MVRMKSLECPNCGGNLESPEDKQIIFCLHCGTKIILDDEIKRVHIKKEIITKEDQIDCAMCGKNILLGKEHKYICKDCGGNICEDCYDYEKRLCKDCTRCSLCGQKAKAEHKAICEYCGLLYCVSCLDIKKGMCKRCARPTLSSKLFGKIKDKADDKMWDIKESIKSKFK